MKYLVKFQKETGLVPDGIIGPNTLFKMKEVFMIPSVEATAHFVGQLAHETAYFKYGVENLNYSVSGLLKVFRKYFPTESFASEYARKPEKIANRVYANRMGNGPEPSGDGWKFRGRGAIQLTGKNNYRAFSEAVQEDFITDPDLVEKEYYWHTALWFFTENNIWPLCSEVSRSAVEKVTRKINGGTNGLEHRYNLTVMYYNMLNR